SDVIELGGGERGVDDRLDDAPLALLDAPRELHFALAGEEWYLRHLAEVHVDRFFGLRRRCHVRDGRVREGGRGLLQGNSLLCHFLKHARWAHSICEDLPRERS